MDMTNINAILGDITTQHIEAIVNAANETLLGGGGVDGAVHKAAGPELLEECRKLGGCPTGEARITNGCRLPAINVIHTVGPVYAMKRHHAPVFLAACYKNCLDLAREHLIRSVAFPSISTGAYGYPFDEAARVAIATVKAWIRKYPDALDEVRFVLHSEADLKCYEELLQAA